MAHRGNGPIALWRIQDFREVGRQVQRWMCKAIILPIFCQELHEIKRIWIPQWYCTTCKTTATTLLY